MGPVPALVCPIILALLLTSGADLARADADADGPDCGAAVTDFGDAPEGVPILGTGSPLGCFPTCLAPGPAGTQEAACMPRSTPPGPTGYVRHVQNPATYWLGCYNNPSLSTISGIDSESDGKVSAPSGPSACSGVATDCDLVPYLAGSLSFGQDECRAGDGDAGVSTDLLIPCAMNQILYTTTNCGPMRQVYLNVLVDQNFDGDWNDVLACNIACAYEWAVKNEPVTLNTGCESRYSPAFLVGAQEGAAWMRVSITDDPVDDDFPWAGSANRPDGSFVGGETEDYLISILTGVPTHRSSWGQLKVRYN